MTRGTLLEIDVRQEETGEVVEVRGELDLTNAGALDEALSGTRSRIVILDVGQLAFVDSAGIRTIDQAHRRLGDEGRALLVVAGEDTRAAWTFRVAGFVDGFVHGSLDAARERAALHPGAS